MTTESQYKSWSQTGPDGTAYLCSTDPELIDLGALNAALGSDMLWWANALAEDRLKKMVDNCLILGLYLLRPETPDQPQGEVPRTMIGGARVITDQVTFGYLTDVYVVEEHQQKGLGTFAMKCLDEILNSWPDLRGFWILSSSPGAQRLYAKIFGATEFFPNPNPELKLLEKRGPANNHKAHED